MARFILLNGAPAAGKSTIAELYVRDHPLSLNLDIDRIRTLIGCWEQNADQAGLIARRLAVAMAAEQLAAGHDVVIPQLVGRMGFLEELDALAEASGSARYEFVLTAHPVTLMARFEQRSAEGARPEHIAAQRLVERGGGARFLQATCEQLADLTNLRPQAEEVNTSDQDPEGSYRQVMVHIHANEKQ